MKNKCVCQQGVSSILRGQQRWKRRKQRLCGHEGLTTDWCWRSVENVPGCGSWEESGGILAERSWQCSGWPLTWKSQGKWKKSGSEIRCVFSSSKYSAGVRPGPGWGSLWCSPRPPSRLGRGHPIPFPQLLQPQLLNNWLSGQYETTTVDHIGKHSSRGKVGEFPVVWKMVTLSVVTFLFMYRSLVS